MQSKTMSAIEAAANTAAGFALSWGVAVVAYPLCGIEANTKQTLAVKTIFTVASVLRSYVVRRLFERLHRPAPDKKGGWASAEA